MRLLLATHNAHKAREFERLMAPATGAARVELDVLDDAVELPPEDGETFADNAFGKARFASVSFRRTLPR